MSRRLFPTSLAPSLSLCSNQFRHSPLPPPSPLSLPPLLLLQPILRQFLRVNETEDLSNFHRNFSSSTDNFERRNVRHACLFFYVSVSFTLRTQKRGTKFSISSELIRRKSWSRFRIKLQSVNLLLPSSLSSLSIRAYMHVTCYVNILRIFYV